MQRMWLIFLMLALGLVACAEADGLSPLEIVERDRKAVEEYRRDNPEISAPCYRAGRGRLESFFHKHFLAWTPDSGHLLFDGEPSAVWLANEKGSSVRMLVGANPESAPVYKTYADISPDGLQIVYATCNFLSRQVNPDYEVAKFDLRNDSQLRLTTKNYLDHYPVWSPDGSRIAFIGVPVNDFNDLGARLYTMAADGSDLGYLVAVVPPFAPSQEEAMEREAVALKLRGVALFPPAWSPDGEKLAFLVYEGYVFPFRKLLYTVRIDGTELTRIAEDVVSVASWSPDGQRLAVAKYAGEARERVTLFSVAADGSDLKEITTITDNTRAFQSSYRSKVHTVSWSPDGSQLLYTCDSGACVVDVEAGRVRELVEGVTAWDAGTYLAAWSPDGARIAIYRPGAGRLYTVAPDGTDRHDLVRPDGDGNLVPANPPEDE